MPDSSSMVTGPKTAPTKKKKYEPPELIVQGTMTETPRAVAGAPIDGFAGSVPL